MIFLRNAVEPCPGGSLEELCQFLPILRNQNVKSLLHSPLLDSALGNNLRHFRQPFRLLKHRNIENLLHRTLQDSILEYDLGECFASSTSTILLCSTLVMMRHAARRQPAELPYATDSKFRSSTESSKGCSPTLCRDSVIPLTGHGASTLRYHGRNLMCMACHFQTLEPPRV